MNIGGKYRPVLTLPFGSLAAPLTVAQNLISRGTLLLGFAVLETTGASAAEFDIVDGNTAAGTMIAPVSLLAGQSVRDTFGGHGLYAQMGPFLALNSGSIRGAIWYVDVTLQELLDTQPIGP